MIFNMTGPGISGGNLTVTTPGAGITVTAARDGKTKTRASGADGTAVFKGLESGDWVLTITDGERTSVPVSITIQTDYATALTFFTATINVSYPEGSSCTATDGVTTLTAPDTGGTWACIVPNAGTWTVTATDGSESKSENAEITTDGQSVSVSIDYGFDLYKAGDERIAVTGGWVTGSTGKGTHSVQKLDSGMHMKCVQGNSDLSDDVGVRTSSKVDLTGYSQLTIQYRIITRSYKLSLKVGTSTAVATSNSSSYDAILDLNGTPGNYEKTLPINFSTQMYIGVCTHCTYGLPTSEFVVERVFLR